MWFEAIQYLRGDDDLREAVLLNHGLSTRLHGKLGAVFWPLTRKKEIPFFPRVVRRGLANAIHLIEKRSTPLPAHCLKGFDVFHSCFYPLPESTRNVSGLNRFLTVCDLINIQQPHFSEDGGAFLKHILRSLLPSDGVIAISETTKNDLCNYRPDLDPERIKVVPLAASGLFFPVTDAQEMQRVKLKYGLGENYFLSVCTLDPRKNLEGLVEGFCRWRQESGSASACLALAGYVGAGWSKIQSVLDRFPMVRNEVRILGYVADLDLAPLYSAALGFAYPSFYEGFGLPVLEAMQCGTPVITSNGSSLKEIAEGSAILIEPSDHDAIAQGLQTLFQMPSERQRLRRVGLERASTFSWEKSTSLLVDAYRALC